MNKKRSENWSAAQASEFYNIPAWGEGYFFVNEQGHMAARINEVHSIDLHAVSMELKARELSYPVLVRLPQLLQTRTREICNAFKSAIHGSGLNTEHIPLYPIKVNQQRTVVEHVLTNDDVKVGLEVGSKTELLAALGLLKTDSAWLICNGYKDRAYIRIALFAQRMGINVFIVIEKLSELTLIAQECARLGVTPQIGVRVRLMSIAAGNWQNTGGRNSKFGLGTHDLLQLLEQLKSSDSTHWLQLLHFHMGSQISSLEDFSRGLQEAMQIYRQIHSHKFDIRYIDVGGGLAIDYSAQQDSGYFSKAYSNQAYADLIIKTIGEVCLRHNLPIPSVLSENGRALTAHHAVLLTNVVEIESKHDHVTTVNEPDVQCRPLTEFYAQIVQAMRSGQPLSEQSIKQFEQEIQQLFVSGEIDLEAHALADNYVQYCQLALGSNSSRDPMVNKYYCNFSVFQSMPDIWGLGQIFPIVPLARLNEQPTERGRLQDLTCDSDGQVSRYAYLSGLSDSLPLHLVNSGEDYVLGCFLVGAYQEVLGDVHNLFGDTHTANVELDGAGELIISELETGDCVSELLQSIHLNSDQVMLRCQQRLIDHQLPQQDQLNIMSEIEDALFSYTYLDSIDRVTHRIKGN